MLRGGGGQQFGRFRRGVAGGRLRRGGERYGRGRRRRLPAGLSEERQRLRVGGQTRRLDHAEVLLWALSPRRGALQPKRRGLGQGGRGNGAG